VEEIARGTALSMLALLTLTAALLPGAPLGTTRPVVLGETAMSRRNALPIFGAGLVAAAALPSMARADEDSIAAIAARANAKAAAEREAKMPKPVREEGDGANLVSAQSSGHHRWWQYPPPASQ
jgi:hypothetical protein